MDGLIIGSGAINYSLRNQDNLTQKFFKDFTDKYDYTFADLSADIWGVADGALTISRQHLSKSHTY